MFSGSDSSTSRAHLAVDLRIPSGTPRNLALDPSTASADGVMTVQRLAADVRSVAVGGKHACALDGSGRVYCWGNDAYEQLGSRWIGEPVDLGGARAVQLSLGAVHSCAILESGKVKCWGGIPQLGSTGSVREIEGVEHAVQLASGTGFACALLSTGQVSCWGANRTWWSDSPYAATMKDALAREGVSGWMRPVLVPTL